MKPAQIILIVVCLAAIQSQVAAKPKFWATFQQTYAVKTGTPIGQAKCLTCHAAPGPLNLNPYGMVVHDAMRSAKLEAVTPDQLHSIENKDSDGDGFNNGVEIVAGTLPGDPKSHPDVPPTGGTHAAGTTMPGMSGHMATPGALAPSNSSLIPLHSFHPQIVHFPIALFLFGGFLEIIGLWRCRSGWRDAAYLCMAGASVTSLAAIATGLTAMFRNEYALKGNILIHLTLAVSATTGMAVTALIGRAAMKKGEERNGWLY